MTVSSHFCVERRRVKRFFLEGLVKQRRWVGSAYLSGFVVHVGAGSASLARHKSAARARAPAERVQEHLLGENRGASVVSLWFRSSYREKVGLVSGRKPSAHLESLAIDHVLDNAVADDRAAEHLLGSDIHALIGEAVDVHAACQERQEE